MQTAGWLPKRNKAIAANKKILTTGSAIPESVYEAAKAARIQTNSKCIELHILKMLAFQPVLENNSITMMKLKDPTKPRLLIINNIITGRAINKWMNNQGHPQVKKKPTREMWHRTFLEEGGRLYPKRSPPKPYKNTLGSNKHKRASKNTIVKDKKQKGGFLKWCTKDLQQLHQFIKIIKTSYQRTTGNTYKIPHGLSYPTWTAKEICDIALKINSHMSRYYGCGEEKKTIINLLRLLSLHGCGPKIYEHLMTPNVTNFESPIQRQIFYNTVVEEYKKMGFKANNSMPYVEIPRHQMPLIRQGECLRRLIQMEICTQLVNNSKKDRTQSFLENRNLQKKRNPKPRISKHTKLNSSGGGKKENNYHHHYSTAVINKPDNYNSDDDLDLSNMPKITPGNIDGTGVVKTKDSAQSRSSKRKLRRQKRDRCELEKIKRCRPTKRPNHFKLHLDTAHMPDEQFKHRCEHAKLSALHQKRVSVAVEKYFFATFKRSGPRGSGNAQKDITDYIERCIRVNPGSKLTSRVKHMIDDQWIKLGKKFNIDLNAPFSTTYGSSVETSRYYHGRMGYLDSILPKEISLGEAMKWAHAEFMKTSTTDLNEVHLMNIDERGFKTRPLTKNCTVLMETMCIYKYLLWQILKLDPATRESVTGQKRQTHNTWHAIVQPVSNLSADLRSATDLIYQDVAEYTTSSALEYFFDVPHNVARKVATAMCGSKQIWTDVKNLDLSHHPNIKTKEISIHGLSANPEQGKTVTLGYLGMTTRGVQMGITGSWFVLSQLQSICSSHMHGRQITGDDLTAAATDAAVEVYKYQCKLVGFEFNDNKSHFGKGCRMGEYCQKITHLQIKHRAKFEMKSIKFNDNYHQSRVVTSRQDLVKYVDPLTPPHIIYRQEMDKKEADVKRTLKSMDTNLNKDRDLQMLLFYDKMIGENKDGLLIQRYQNKSLEVPVHGARRRATRNKKWVQVFKEIPIIGKERRTFITQAEFLKYNALTHFIPRCLSRDTEKIMHKGRVTLGPESYQYLIHQAETFYRDYSRASHPVLYFKAMMHQFVSSGQEPMFLINSVDQDLLTEDEDWKACQKESIKEGHQSMTCSLKLYDVPKAPMLLHRDKLDSASNIVADRDALENAIKEINICHTRKNWTNMYSSMTYLMRRSNMFESVRKVIGIIPMSIPIKTGGLGIGEMDTRDIYKLAQWINELQVSQRNNFRDKTYIYRLTRLTKLWEAYQPNRLDPATGDMVKPLPMDDLELELSTKPLPYVTRGEYSKCVQGGDNRIYELIYNKCKSKLKTHEINNNIFKAIKIAKREWATIAKYHHQPPDRVYQELLRSRGFTQLYVVSTPEMKQEKYNPLTNRVRTSVSQIENGRWKRNHIQDNEHQLIPKEVSLWRLRENNRFTRHGESGKYWLSNANLRKSLRLLKSTTSELFSYPPKLAREEMRRNLQTGVKIRHLMVNNTASAKPRLHDMLSVNIARKSLGIRKSGYREIINEKIQLNRDHNRALAKTRKARGGTKSSNMMELSDYIGSDILNSMNQS
jgi:hypothetical protein